MMSIVRNDVWMVYWYVNTKEWDAGDQQRVYNNILRKTVPIEYALLNSGNDWVGIIGKTEKKYKIWPMELIVKYMF